MKKTRVLLVEDGGKCWRALKNQALHCDGFKSRERGVAVGCAGASTHSHNGILRVIMDVVVEEDWVCRAVIPCDPYGLTGARLVAVILSHSSMDHQVDISRADNK